MAPAPASASRLGLLGALVCRAAVAQDVLLGRDGVAANASGALLGSAASLLGGPPRKALDYGGVALPAMKVSGPGPSHIFAIGDWGGLDGTLWTGQYPPEGRNRLIAYSWGAEPGPSVFPRTRWNKAHSKLLCSHKQFVACYQSRGSTCHSGCGFVDGVDTRPQQLVATQFRSYAAKLHPDYILNVGDNFYWGGIERDCGTPMSVISPEARHQFSQVFESMYNGPGLSNVPWLTVLGNHDWGGRVFHNAWDQQIAYTWVSSRWKLPAPYFSQHVDYADQGFTVDLFFLDSNAMDAKEPNEDPEHNMCSAKYNPPGASCKSTNGPASVASCKQWFWDLWAKNQAWALEKVAQSRADWQIVVTHFPCGHERGFYRQLRGLGLDLLVTGHRHDQELWDSEHPGARGMGGLTCFVTGGGGGISSEATPVEDDGNWYGEAQYGFYDLAISKAKIDITSIDYRGKAVKSAVVRPV